MLFKKLIYRLSNKLNSRSFFRNAGVLTLGTFGSQLLILVFYPVLTRLYTPAEFGVISIVYMITSLLAIFASGAAEGAILIATSKRSAVHVIGWVAIRTIKVLFIAFILSLILLNLNIDQFIAHEVQFWLPVVPILAATTVLFNCFSEWILREQQFSRLAYFRIIQSFLVSILRTALGVLNSPINGLIVGEMCGKVLATAMGTRSMLFDNFHYFRAISIKRIGIERRRYYKFPRYMMPDHLINTAGGTIHIPFVAMVFGSTELGFLSMSMSILYLPVTVVSSAIKDVFRQRATVVLQSGGSCRALYLNLLLPVSIVGLIGFGILYSLSHWLFTFILGDSWAPVGEYSRILIPMYFLNFVSMSMGGVLVVTQRLGVSLAWQIANLGITLVALIIGAIVYQSIYATLFGFTIAKSISYILHMLLSYHYSSSRNSL